VDEVRTMGARKPALGWLGRFVRRWRFDRNPLRRAADRAETALLATLVIAFLVGAPFVALATGAWVHGIAQRVQLAQDAARTQVTAVVLAVAQPSAGQELAWEAQARWTAPDGREVTDEIPVESGTAIGGSIRIWVDRTGDLTNAPLLDSQVTGQTDLGEALGFAVTGVVLTFVGVMAHWSFNKRRMAAWDADWHATGPRWTTRA
jgi:hypothetical protein